MTKLQQDVEAERKRLQKEHDEMVSYKDKLFIMHSHEREEKMEEDPGKRIILVPYVFCI